MKMLLAVLIASCVLAFAIFGGFGSFHWHARSTVFADEPLGSRFLNTYDPDPILSKFGTLRQGNGSRGSSKRSPETTETRTITKTVVLPESQVAGLRAALRDDIAAKLEGQGRVWGRSEDSDENSYEYESGNNWGYFILEPIERKPSVRGDGETWRVRMRFIERSHQ